MLAKFKPHYFMKYGHWRYTWRPVFVDNVDLFVARARAENYTRRLNNARKAP